MKNTNNLWSDVFPPLREERYSQWFVYLTQKSAVSHATIESASPICLAAEMSACNDATAPRSMMTYFGSRECSSSVNGVEKFLTKRMKFPARECINKTYFVRSVPSFEFLRELFRQENENSDNRFPCF